MDFSSGSNEFVAMLKRKCNASGGALANTCSFVGYDIVPGKFHEDFIKSNWFKVQKADVRSSPPRSLLLALRPTQVIRCSWCFEDRHGCQELLGGSESSGVWNAPVVRAP